MTDENPKIKKVAAKARGKAHDAVCNLWWWLLLRGVALLVLAVCALVWPQKTVDLMVKILGIFLIVDGIWAGIAYGFSEEKDQSLLASAIGLLVGAVLLFWTGVSSKVFMTIIGIWAFLQGFGLYLSARREAEADLEARSLVKGMAIGLVIVGLVLVVWPSTGVVAIGWLISGMAGLLGCAMVFVAIKLRAIGQRLDGQPRESEPAAE